MRKYLAGIIMILILMVPLAGASNILLNNPKKETINNTSNEEYTHKVFVEYGTMTTCPYCVTASAQLISIYNSGDQDFDFVTLVWNKGNKNVRTRLKDLGVTSVPDVFFDGKFKHILGAQDDETPYREKINISGARVVPNIDMDLSVAWKGGGTLKITVDIKNNEAETFSGRLRVYIAEKVSRWNDLGGTPYSFGVVDIPVNKTMSLIAGTTTYKKTWLGGLYGFANITKDNTVVMATLFDADTDYVVETADKEPTTCSIITEIPNLLLPDVLEKLVDHFPLLNL
jgi:glutaredoxin